MTSGGLRRAVLAVAASGALAAAAFAAPAGASQEHAHHNNGNNGNTQSLEHSHRHGHHHHGNGGGEENEAGNVLVVTLSGSDSGSCGDISNPCRTIGQAVTNASSGDTIKVETGSYSEGVTIDKQLDLRGFDATIDASGHDNGIHLAGSGASGSSIHGFTVENATGEGILLTSVDNVSIRDNHVLDNDRGAHTSSYPPCQDMGPVPGDCGEAIHLQGTTNSRIEGNRVDHNVGGILVTDETGVTAHNLIAWNVVIDNAEDCGITMPAHAPGLGVLDNTVRDNVVAHNGAAGVLIATPGPGMSVTGNLITENMIVENGEGGVQLHAHAPGHSIDDNTITRNAIGTNNTAGDTDSGDLSTTGVIVFSAVVPVNGLVIQQNVIFDDQIGVWLSSNVDATGITNNTFSNVTTEIQQ